MKMCKRIIATSRKTGKIAYRSNHHLTTGICGMMFTRWAKGKKLKNYQITIVEG